MTLGVMSDVISSSAISHVVHGLSTDFECTPETVLYLFVVGAGRSDGRWSMPGGVDTGREGVSVIAAEDFGY